MRSFVGLSSLVACLLLALVGPPVAAAPARAQLRATGGILPAALVDQAQSGRVRLRNVGDAEGAIVSCEFTGPDASRFSVDLDEPGADGCDVGHRFGYAGQEEVKVVFSGGPAGDVSASLRVTYDIDIDDGADATDELSVPVSTIVMTTGPWVATRDPVDIGVVVNGDHEEFAIWIENSLDVPVAFDRARVSGEVGDLEVKREDPDGCRNGQVFGPGDGCYLFIHDTGDTSDPAGDHALTQRFAIDSLPPYDIASFIRVSYVDRNIPGHLRPEIVEVRPPAVRGLSIGRSVRIRVSTWADADDDRPRGVDVLHIRFLGNGKQVVRGDMTPNGDGEGSFEGLVPVGQRIQAEAWAHDTDGYASARKRSSSVTYTAVDATKTSARAKTGSWSLASGVARTIGRSTLTSAIGRPATITYRVAGRYIALVIRKHPSTVSNSNGCVRVLVDGAELEGGCVRAPSTQSRIVLEYTGPSTTHSVKIQASGRVIVDGLIIAR